MLRSLQKLTEARIAKARAQGQFEDLRGAGKPLNLLPGDAFLDTGTAVGHRIMAEAGALPEEIVLKRKVDAARVALSEATGAARKAAMRELADLGLKLAIAQEARRKFMR